MRASRRRKEGGRGKKKEEGGSREERGGREGRGRKEEQRRVLLQRNFPFLWGRFKVTIVHTHGDKILPCGTEDIYSCFFSLHSHNRHHSFQQGFSTSALLTFELDNSSLGGASLGIARSFAASLASSH